MRTGCGAAVAAALGAVLGWTGPLWAWNESGHTTMGVIVYRHLRPEVRAKLDDILRAHPRYAEDLLSGYAGDPSDEAAKAEHAFAKAGVWPDVLRNRQHPMHATHHRGIWHYTDRPFHPFGGEDRFVPQRPEPVQPGEPVDVVTAYVWNLERLKDETLPASERAIALCWVLHLAADMHQPCHTMSMYSERHPTGDRGANEWMLTFRGERRNLHALWDGWIGTDRSMAFARRRAAEIESLHPREQLSAELAEPDVNAWVAAAAELAIRYVYHFGMINYPTRAEAEANPTVTPPAVTEAYAAAATAVSLRQAALASYRMVDALNGMGN